MTIPFQPCPGIVAVSMTFSQSDGEFAENVFHVTNDTGDAWAGSELIAAANAFVVWWVTGSGGNNYSTFQAPAVELVACRAVDLTTVDALTADQTVDGLPVPATGTGDQLPNGLTISITGRTALRGKSYRGRSFPVGLRADSVTSDDANIMKPDVAANLVTAWSGMLPGGDSDVAAYSGMPGSSAVCILSRYNQDDVPTPPHRRTDGIGTPVVQYGMHDNFMDYQRRRAPGHNRHH